MAPRQDKLKFSYTAALFALMIAWGLIIWFINPVGEFMINDDWSFVKALETLSVEGGIPATGWGQGGPSLLTHLLWGWMFTTVFGFSVTVLRISVLVMAVLGSIGFMELLKRTGASPFLAFWGAMTLVLNPLFLSQSFTFMTDVTLATLMIFAMLFISQGLESRRRSLVGLGLFFTLAALLTRQIAIAIPIGLIITLFINSKTRSSDLRPVTLMILFISIVPWLCFEYTLKKLGSTSLTDHEVIHAIVNDPLQLGLHGYVDLLFGRVVIGIGYISVIVSPIVALSFKELFAKKIFRSYFLITTAVFLVVETGICLGLIHLPVAFYRNVIFDFGIGPLLLKDTYILHLARTWAIPASLYYCLAYWAFLNTGALVLLAYSYISGIFDQPVKGRSYLGAGVISILGFVTAIVYVGIILLTGYHDRYLIPVCILLIMWLVSNMGGAIPLISLRVKTAIPAFICMAVIGVFSVAGTRDFMATKTALKQAQDYLVQDCHVSPCAIDGGFEFNGFNCYKKGFVQKPGLSWWWVEKENYLLALGPLPGYTVDTIFPFKRIFPHDGAVYVLKNESAPIHLHAELTTHAR